MKRRGGRRIRDGRSRCISGVLAAAAAAATTVTTTLLIVPDHMAATADSKIHSYQEHTHQYQHLTTSSPALRGGGGGKKDVAVRPPTATTAASNAPSSIPKRRRDTKENRYNSRSSMFRVSHHSRHPPPPPPKWPRRTEAKQHLQRRLPSCPREEGIAPNIPPLPPQPKLKLPQCPAATSDASVPPPPPPPWQSTKSLTVRRQCEASPATVAAAAKPPPMPRQKHKQPPPPPPHRVKNADTIEQHVTRKRSVPDSNHSINEKTIVPPPRPPPLIGRNALLESGKLVPPLPPPRSTAASTECIPPPPPRSATKDRATRDLEMSQSHAFRLKNDEAATSVRPPPPPSEIDDPNSKTMAPSPKVSARAVPPPPLAPPPPHLLRSNGSATGLAVQDTNYKNGSSRLRFTDRTESPDGNRKVSRLSSYGTIRRADKNKKSSDLGIFPSRVHSDFIQPTRRRRREAFAAMNALPFFLVDKREEGQAATRALISQILHTDGDGANSAAAMEIRRYLDEYLERLLNGEEDADASRNRGATGHNVFQSSGGMGGPHLSWSPDRLAWPMVLSSLRYYSDTVGKQKSLGVAGDESFTTGSSAVPDCENKSARVTIPRRVMKKRRVHNSQGFLSTLHDFLDEIYDGDDVSTVRDEEAVEDDCIFEEFLRSVREPDFRIEEYSDYELDVDSTSDQGEKERGHGVQSHAGVESEKGTSFGHLQRNALEVQRLQIPTSAGTSRGFSHEEVDPVLLTVSQASRTKQKAPIALVDMDLPHYRSCHRLCERDRSGDIFIEDGDGEEEKLDDFDMEVLRQCDERHTDVDWLPMGRDSGWEAEEREIEAISSWDDSESEFLDEREIGLLLECNLVDEGEGVEGDFRGDIDDASLNLDEVYSDEEFQSHYGSQHAEDGSNLWPTDAKYARKANAEEKTSVTRIMNDLAKSDDRIALESLTDSGRGKEEPDWGILRPSRVPSRRKSFSIWEFAPFPLFRSPSQQVGEDVSHIADAIKEETKEEEDGGLARLNDDIDEQCIASNAWEKGEKSLYPTNIKYEWKEKSKRSSLKEIDRGQFQFSGLKYIWRRLFGNSAPVDQRSGTRPFVDTRDQPHNSDVQQMEDDENDLSLGESARTSVTDKTSDRYGRMPPPPPPSQLPYRYQESC